MPVDSVSPYACQNLHLKTSMLRARTSSLIGDAPYTMIRRLEKSASSTPGTISMNWSTTGTRNAWVIPCSPNIPTNAAGSSSRTMTLVQPSYIPAVAHPPPPMWNSGIATRLTESGENSQISLATGSNPKKLVLLSITPLGRPVVPDE